MGGALVFVYFTKSSYLTLNLKIFVVYLSQIVLRMKSIQDS
ncbi:MAG: hypothetical protein CM1200mP39_11350 [Dehalococcoidia bacterium]|nr:MAG: hypothetical protein CM1200mP39_11350 [Dehalococcoidia bacterium]